MVIEKKTQGETRCPQGFKSGKIEKKKENISGSVWVMMSLRSDMQHLPVGSSWPKLKKGDGCRYRLKICFQSQERQGSADIQERRRVKKLSFAAY